MSTDDDLTVPLGDRPDHGKPRKDAGDDLNPHGDADAGDTMAAGATDEDALAAELAAAELAAAELAAEELAAAALEDEDGGETLAGEGTVVVDRTVSLDSQVSVDIDRTVPVSSSAAPAPSRRRSGRRLDAKALIGRELGVYKVLSKLGEGGMGYVLKGRDQNLNRFVALKVLHPRMAGNATFVDQFKVEAEALAKLSHPNVVNVYSFGEDDGLVYFAMQFVRGYELTSLLKDRGQMSARELVDVMIPVCQGLAYTHGYGILHRDLKPANVMIDESTGAPIVTDFGLARMDATVLRSRLDPDGDLHISDKDVAEEHLVGTPAYMSPELFAPDVYEGADEQADVYAIGVMMYQLLTGKIPFSGGSPAEILQAALTQDPADIVSLVPEPPPPALLRVVKKAMARDPKERYSKMEFLLKDLEDVKRQWTQAAEVQERADMSRDMAMAMTAARPTRSAGGGGIGRILGFGLLVVLGLAGLLFLIPSGDEPPPPGPDLTAGIGSRSGDQAWTAGETVRVFGEVIEVSEEGSETVVTLLDLLGEEERFAYFRIASDLWKAHPRARHLKRGDRAILAGTPGTTEEAAAEFTRPQVGPWFLPLSSPTLRAAADGDQLEGVGKLADVQLDSLVEVSGIIVGVVVGGEVGEEPYLDCTVFQESREEDTPPLLVTFAGRIPKTSGGTDVRVGDYLVARGYLLERGWVEVREAEHFQMSSVRGVLGQ